MDKLPALKSLKGMVESGTSTMPDHTKMYDRVGGIINPTTWNDSQSMAAACGHSETAAFTFLRERLGDRWAVFLIAQTNTGWQCTLARIGGCEVSATHAYLPTAILLAVIEALIFELENEDG